MLMPKTAVNQNDGVMLWDHDIGFAWQIFTVQAETNPRSMQQLSDDEFWGCITTLYCRHSQTALFRTQVVHDSYLARRIDVQPL